jgi:hypothetical protein
VGAMYELTMIPWWCDRVAPFVQPVEGGSGAGVGWEMYYFGGDGSYGPTPYGKARGIHMAIGKAVSRDGLTWTRRPKPVLTRGQ